MNKMSNGRTIVDANMYMTSMPTSKKIMVGSKVITSMK